MRFRILNLLCLVLCTLGTFAFGELEDTSETASLQLSLVSDTLWAEELTTFQELLDTDAKAARAELQQVANTLFGGHRLAEEWVPLYFRLSQNGTEHPSDVKRVSELEIRMLTDIDFKKYSVQIHLHQAAPLLPPSPLLLPPPPPSSFPLLPPLLLPPSLSHTLFSLPLSLG